MHLLVPPQRRTDLAFLEVLGRMLERFDDVAACDLRDLGQVRRVDVRRFACADAVRRFDADATPVRHLAAEVRGVIHGGDAGEASTELCAAEFRISRARGIAGV